jgi:hypothetical protein
MLRLRSLMREAVNPAATQVRLYEVQQVLDH